MKTLNIRIFALSQILRVLHNSMAHANSFTFLKQNTTLDTTLLLPFHNSYLVPVMFLTEEEMHLKSKSSKSSGINEDSISETFLKIHESCMDRIATPRKYMTYLKTYKSIFADKKQGIVTKQHHLQV